ncbi:acyl-CoA dehydrogenase family protein [Mycobacterium marseillense]|uniref:Acyl-CoA dehydrogenase n=1 Tax=Mycobacterium marseillense TaxID=701042 RepID=A0ABN5ZVU8_9MYCO|nr:acyl-CoA dehydrogenase family protein [Mycobacterium marseillense]MCV7406387.1 acyl-CoA dehydrogenase family protein [Mycobacterium marseillense]ORA89575.1 acyl-CoA dehydrogenase [Mycobacterium marseillense]BBY12532.1 acyl-CoA dehydrogenase [Mycobacterium marseillense]
MTDPGVEPDATYVERLALDLIGLNNPRTMRRREFLGLWFDAGLTWVHFPKGLGGLGISRGLQAVADRVLRDAGGTHSFTANPIGYGMAGPTLVEHARPEIARELLRPLASCEHIWCQLFSEPGAGSDLAGLATMAVRTGDEWAVNGQKVWTSGAQVARYGLLLARTDPDAPKHKGLTYFVVDMHAAGVDVRPLRQITGHAEFNEVFLSDVRVPDAHRLGEPGEGWRVAMTTLTNERSAIGGGAPARGSGTIADALSLWRSRPDLHTPALRRRLAQIWARAEAQRITGQRARAAAKLGSPGPEGAISKLVWAELNQSVYELCMDLLGMEGTLHNGYGTVDVLPRRDELHSIPHSFLRSRANTIEGGTSEVLRNILGERILGLPGDLRADANKPWREIQRG